MKPADLHGFAASPSANASKASCSLRVITLSDPTIHRTIKPMP